MRVFLMIMKLPCILVLSLEWFSWLLLFFGDGFFGLQESLVICPSYRATFGQLQLQGIISQEEIWVCRNINTCLNSLGLSGIQNKTSGKAFMLS